MSGAEPRRDRGRRLAAAALLAAATVSGCAEEPHAPPPFDHLLMISIDTLRADFLGCYGHPYVQTPHIDRLAREGLLFEQHVSVAPETLPSHMSLMTGNYPRTHGTPRNRFIVRDENVMFAERLRGRGFDTAAFIAALPLSHHFNFDQGFDHFDEPPRLPGRRNARAVTDAALEWLRAGEFGPSFVFVHYFDVHAPYENGEPYDSMYRQGASDARRPRTGEVARALRQGSPEAQALTATSRAYYAGGVSFVDEQIGRLLEGLRELDLLDRTLIVVTSDHGESMDVHPLEYWNHGLSVFDEALRTPLILRFPGAWNGGTRIGHLVANIDVMPTLLELLDLPLPPGIEGRSFLSLLQGGSDPVREAVFVEATKPAVPAFEEGTKWTNERKMRGIRTASWKLVYLPSAERYQLYDVGSDPDETNDLAQSAPDQRLLEELRERLEAWAGDSVQPTVPATLDAQVREQLRALGYGG